MSTRPKTLLEMQGASLDPARLQDATLIVIDLQEEYRSGALPLTNINHAAAEAARMIDRARKVGTPVVHVLHEVGEGAPIFNPSSCAYAPMAEVTPTGGEKVVVKRAPNAFANTDLLEVIRQTGRVELILIGAMTHMCVSATARAALDLGFRTTVVAEACATRDLPALDGGTLAAADVHRIALAELADAFAVVVPDVASFS